MLTIGISIDGESVIIIRHARVPGTKKLYEINGPVLRIRSREARQKLSSIARAHFEQSRLGEQVFESSEIETMTAMDRIHLLDHRKYVVLWEKDNTLLVTPTEVLAVEPLNLRYYSERYARVIEAQCSAEAFWDVLIKAFRSSKLRAPA